MQNADVLKKQKQFATICLDSLLAFVETLCIVSSAIVSIGFVINFAVSSSKKAVMEVMGSKLFGYEILVLVVGCLSLPLVFILTVLSFRYKKNGLTDQVLQPQDHFTLGLFVYTHFGEIWLNDLHGNPVSLSNLVISSFQFSFIFYFKNYKFTIIFSTPMTFITKV